MRSDKIVFLGFVLLLGSCGGQSSVSEASPVDPAEQAATHLRNIVTSVDEPPRGTKLYEEVVGVEALARMFEGYQAPEWAQVGFVDARMNAFVGEDGVGLVGPIGMVYEDEAAAIVAFEEFTDLLSAKPPRGFGFPDGEPLDLGDEGWSYAADIGGGDSPCRPKASYLWRSGALIVHVLTCGRPEVEQIDEVARAIAADAEAAGF